MEWEKGEAIWKQIERQLLRDIAQGMFKPGEKLPTEKELAARFEVNRHTVRSAIAALTESNVTRVEQGRGTFVQEAVLDYPLGTRTRFSQTVSGRHRLPDKLLIKASVEKASKTVAKNLEIKIATPVVRLESISVADDIPLGHSVSYLPADRFKGIEKIFEETKSLTESFKHYDIRDYTRKYTRIIAQLPTANIATLLKQAKNKPILQTESVDVDVVGQPIEYGITSFSSDRVQLLVNN
ncbi:phosphonate metabolism transcriptional regulator PhnF [Terasakiella sp. A23]|uniref:phosphonate metabolism transcriptional regulator PhnF n=1 Tax=Terasakiella sp. FCG-A23 TaxID=3080561 RepID=UPI0029543132|nr:phosphonate metabolism transcriptional regulator PhnF [Terasakiella sp. A23]MDV7340324.1 phosphonate metabolism transcriptional regulator PhnF [Terasakiella sp. A23]